MKRNMTKEEFEAQRLGVVYHPSVITANAMVRFGDISKSVAFGIAWDDLQIARRALTQEVANPIRAEKYLRLALDRLKIFKIELPEIVGVQHIITAYATWILNQVFPETLDYGD